MTNTEFNVRVRGRRVSRGRLDPEPAAAVLRRLKSLAEDAVGMSFRGASRSRGRRPAWMRRAADVRFLDVSAGKDESTVLHFVAPHFGEVAEEVYRQGELFGSLPDQSDSAFDVLGDTIKDIKKGSRDSDRFDVGVLRRIEGFKEPVFHHGVDDIAWFGGRLPDDQPPIIDLALADRAASLYQEIPAPVRARIAGRLDMIRVSDKVFTLILRDHQKVRGIWLGESVSSMRDHLGRDVVVNGVVTYRASGSILRLDAEAIDTATDADRLFAKLPNPSSQPLRRSNLTQLQTHSTNMKAVFGRWPGEESDEEVLATLAEVE